MVNIGVHTPMVLIYLLYCITTYCFSSYALQYLCSFPPFTGLRQQFENKSVNTIILGIFITAFCCLPHWVIPFLISTGHRVMEAKFPGNFVGKFLGAQKFLIMLPRGKNILTNIFYGVMHLHKDSRETVGTNLFSYACCVLFQRGTSVLSVISVEGWLLTNGLYPRGGSLSKISLPSYVWLKME